MSWSNRYLWWLLAIVVTALVVIYFVLTGTGTDQLISNQGDVRPK